MGTAAHHHPAGAWATSPMSDNLYTPLQFLPMVKCLLMKVILMSHYDQLNIMLTIYIGKQGPKVCMLKTTALLEVLDFYTEVYGTMMTLH